MKADPANSYTMQTKSRYATQALSISSGPMVQWPFSGATAGVCCNYHRRKSRIGCTSTLHEMAANQQRHQNAREQ
jgi:hypothetical protein